MGTWVAIVGIFLFRQAEAGVISSGGGNAIVCRSVDGSIKSAQLLDLYEASAKFGLPLAPSKQDLSADYLWSTHRRMDLRDIPGVDPSAIAQVAKDQMARFFSLTKFTGPGEHLPLLKDQGEAAAPPAGCSLEQLAIFDDLQHQIHIDKEIWDQLDTQGRSGLILHELVYQFVRWIGEKTSENTRALVSYSYSSGPVPTVLAGLPKKRQSCSTVGNNTHDQTSKFYIYEDSASGKVVLQFEELMGRDFMSKGIITLPKLEPVELTPIEGYQSNSWGISLLRQDGFLKLAFFQHGKEIEHARIECWGSGKEHL